MCNRYDDTIGVLDIFEFGQRHTVFVHRVTFTCPRVDNDRGNTVFVQALDNIINLAVAGIGAILLECQTENDYLGILRSLSRFVPGLPVSSPPHEEDRGLPMACPSTADGVPKARQGPGSHQKSHLAKPRGS